MQIIQRHIKEIDALSVSTRSIEDALRSNDEEHARRLTEIDREYRSTVQDAMNACNRNITDAKKARNDRVTAIDACEQKIHELELMIPNTFREDDALCDEDLQAQACDWGQVESLIKKIRDDSLWEGIEGSLYVDGYQSKEEMALECRKKLGEAKLYAAQERNDAANLLKKCQFAAKSRLDTVSDEANESKKERSSVEDSNYAAVKEDLGRQLQDMVSCQSLAPLLKDMKDSYRRMRGKPEHFRNFRLPKTVEKELLLGHLQYKADTPKACNNSLNIGLAPFCEYPTVTIPFAVSLSVPFSIVVETSKACHEQVVSGVSSIAFRFISSYPVGKSEVIIIDPAGKGAGFQGLDGLTTANECAAVRKSAASVLDIEDEITRLSGKCAIGDGHQRLLIINGYPNGMSEASYTAFLDIFESNSGNRPSLLLIRNSERRLCDRLIDDYSKLCDKSICIREINQALKTRVSGNDYPISFLAMKSIPGSAIKTVEREYRQLVADKMNWLPKGV